MKNNIRAIILAAGSGKRMRPITDNTHKTLLEINGVSIISNIIEKLIKNNINNITIVLGYRAEEVKNHVVKAFPGVSIDYVLNARFDDTNNLVSLAMALESVTTPSEIIIIEADLIYDESVIKRLIESKYDNVALVDQFRPGMDGTVVTVSNNTVTGLIPPHLQGVDFNFKDKYKTLNIYKFSAEFSFGTFKNLLSFFTKSIKDSYYEVILGIIIYTQSETIHAEIINKEKWSEIDDPNDLQVAKFVFDEDRIGFLDRSYGGFWNYPILDFCYLRNMYFPPASLLSELKNNFDKTIYEYGSSQKTLNQKMSFFLECDPANILCLNGLSQLFPILKEYFKEKSFLLPTPTFGEYDRTFLNASCYSDSVGIDMNHIKNSEANVVVFVNPNNPTGTTVLSNDIYQFAKENQSKIVIVDESFIDFSSEKSMVDLLKLNPLDNVLVIKSLSKCLGVAGLRIGFCYSSNCELLADLQSYVPIWNMNSVAENFLEILLKNKPQFKKSLELVKRDRSAFFDALHKVPFIEKVFSSGGNFLLVKTNLSAQQEKKLRVTLMSEHHIYLKFVTDKFSDQSSWMRIAVHQPQINERLVKSMIDFDQDVLQSQKS
jgi:histidinol-phosphate/aromatic aminotransferase/cobyric acid decarboxylase-like protein/choline kinase